MRHKACPGTDHRLVRDSEVREIEEAEERSSRDEYKEWFTHGKRFHRTMPCYMRIGFWRYSAYIADYIVLIFKVAEHAT